MAISSFRKKILSEPVFHRKVWVTYSSWGKKVYSLSGLKVIDQRDLKGGV